MVAYAGMCYCLTSPTELLGGLTVGHAGVKQQLEVLVGPPPVSVGGSSL